MKKTIQILVVVCFAFSIMSILIVSFTVLNNSLSDSEFSLDDNIIRCHNSCSPYGWESDLTIIDSIKNLSNKEIICICIKK